MRPILMCLAAGLVAGCGGDVPRSTVTGRVTFRGQPLRDAAVVFLASDNGTHALILDADGRYRVDRVARGPVRVVVQPEPEGAMVGRPQPSGPPKRPTADADARRDDAKDAARLPAELPPPTLKSGPPIPAKYAKADTSGLSFELKEPTQEYNLDIP